MAPSMWQTAVELTKTHDQATGRWLKLQNDGDNAVVVFLGDPYPREMCFIDGKYIELDDKLKSEGQKSSLRIALNVALFDTLEVKVFEIGALLFKDLVRVREKYGLEKWAFKVQRHGAAKDPKTSYSLLPEHQLTPEQQQTFQALAQHDLKKIYKTDGDTRGASTLGSYDQQSGEAIEPRLAQGLATQLKALPREAIDRFLQKFGVQRIRDLSAWQADRATAFVEQLMNEFSRTPESDSEIDPFAF